ncbi:hypothetical protein [Psychroflexus halocasei]|uniref:Cytochrome C and Quinol oxidase polypeptide I n=1 Tax=Psychroflexus halocasei TaxID=908615 RepID=A0A1H3ZNA2_9FLAO|nr:hypothetical protein [Psychroflexus halocasei]SEA25266.1 hypothetical protein SAMN05421540_104147 [Psychroflexus halocasei]
MSLSLKKQTNISLSFFLIAAVIGLFLRFLFIADVEVDFKYFLHAHSHVALMGWVYLAMLVLIRLCFFDTKKNKKQYNGIFVFTLITVVGMLCSFPFQGYAAISITFSTLFLFASYWFYWFFIKHASKQTRQLHSYRILKYALIYMLISSIGPWAVGGVMATLGSGSVWYRIAIYFYLHFQYNAWIILGLIGIFVYVLEHKGILIEKKAIKVFLMYFNSGLILTFFLSILFIEPHGIYYILSIAGGALQLVSLYYIKEAIPDLKTKVKQIFSHLEFTLLKWVSILLLIKFVIQFFAGFKPIADLITNYKNLTIGFLHWTFLGVITLSLFVLLSYFKLIKINKAVIYFYALGFLLTEALIFWRPISFIFNLDFSIPQYILLFVASLLLVIGILIIMLKQFTKKI